MTYIVGIKEFDHTAIICDTKVSYSKPSTEIGFALKSSYLFAGCIYGASTDDVRGLTRFLEHWWGTALLVTSKREICLPDYPRP